MVDPESPLSYLLIILLILFSAFFSGSEAAYSNCNKYRLKVWADDGGKRAKMASYVVQKFDSTIIVILIATNILHVATSIFATLIAVELLGDSGSIVSTILITILIFMFGEILPKNIAKANADKWALNSALPIIIFMILLFPLTCLFTLLIYVTRKIIGKKHQEENFTDDDFQDVVAKNGQEGVIDEEESEIIIAAVDFCEILVSDVLTKRDDIVALDINKCNNKYLLKYLQTTSYSRIPVYQGSIDNIIGILHVRTYLKELWSNNKLDVRSILKPCYNVSPRIKLDDMFNGFKEHKTHIAIVKDKNRTLGMVTMKDVLEELVTNIDEKGTSDEAGDNNGH